MKATIEKDKDSFFHKVEAVLDNKEGFLNAVGIDAVAFSKESFTLQRLGSRKWKSPANPNLAGIWEDAEQNRSSPSRRFSNRNALIDTGRLRGSITYRVEGNAVFIGTNVPYAKILHYGGTKTLTKNNPNFNRNIEDIVRKNKNKMSSKDASRVWALRSLTQLSVQVPPRPFLGYTKDRLERVLKESLVK